VHVQKLNQVLYGVLALLWIALGTGALVGLAPAEHTAEEIHVTRELGAATVFLGFMHAWCIRNRGRRRAVHFGLMLFAALFAGIHWRDWAVGLRTLPSPLLNSLPFALLLLIAWNDRRAARAGHAPPGGGGGSGT
jgi:hypothetical protein